MPSDLPRPRGSRATRRGHLRLLPPVPVASTSSDQITSFVSVARLLLPSSGLSPERAELVEQDLATLDAEARRTTPREDVCQAQVLAVVDELTAASTTPQPGA